MTRLDVCIDYILSALECLLSLALATLTLSLPAVSCLQAITTSPSVMVVVLASVLLVGVVLVYTLMAYATISAAISRTHYLY